MADHYHPSLAQTQTTSSSLLRKLREHVSNSGQLFGIMTLLITGSILLLLTGLILFAPLIILTSPIWVPLCTVFFHVTAILLSMCGFGLVAVAVLTWMYRYSKGLRPPGSDRVKDRGVQSKAMDAAPRA